MVDIAIHPRFAMRLAIVALTSLCMLFPPTIFGPQVASATICDNTDGDGTDTATPGASCSIGNSSAGERSEGVPPPDEQDHPIFFLRGAVVERETDLDVPGPTVDWSHTRNYDSQITTTSGGPLETGAGERWFSDTTGPYLVRLGTGDISMNVTASTKREFAFAGGGNYTPPAGWRVQLTSSIQADEDDLDADSDDTEEIEVFTLIHLDSGKVYRFLGFDVTL